MKTKITTCLVISLLLGAASYASAYHATYSCPSNSIIESVVGGASAFFCLGMIAALVFCMAIVLGEEFSK